MAQTRRKCGHRAERVAVNELVSEALIRKPARCCLEVFDLGLARNHLIVRKAVPRIIELQSRIARFAVGAREIVKMAAGMTVCKERVRKQDNGVPGIYGLNESSRQCDPSGSVHTYFAHDSTVSVSSRMRNTSSHNVRKSK